MIFLERYLSDVETLDRHQKQCFENFSREHVVNMKIVGAFKKLVRISAYSKPDDFKKPSVLASILRFL